LKACGNTRAAGIGQEIHDKIVMRGLLKTDIALGNALVDMYVKCGMLAKAQEVLKELPTNNVISWSSLIAGYACQGDGQEALKCFEQMQNEGLSPNPVTFISILKACGSLGAIDRGKQIHDDVLSRGLLHKDVLLGTALVDMYAKCGFLTRAREVLEELLGRDVVSWNALISGYAEHGHCHEALVCFNQMHGEGLSPNVVTFLAVLTACSHSGLLDEAQILFGNMTGEYGFSPNVEHHTCMMGVLGCAGLFNNAISVIKAMPTSNYPGVWRALLGACRKWGNVELGKLAFDQALQLDTACAVVYVLMANIFASAGMKEDAERIEAMKVRYATSSSLETAAASRNFHSFAFGDMN
jgi:pentatricopeptide repeat protein